MKKLVVILISILSMLIGIILIYDNSNYKVLINKIENNKINSNSLTMMFETEANSGEYQLSNDNIWPLEEYIFNEKLSGCENGSKLTWDDENKKIIMQANISDKCYVYFDYFNEKYFNSVILSDNPTVLTRNDFSTPYVEDNTGTIYVADGNKTEDINGDGIGEKVYYFAGNALNNWVKFGKNENNEDLYWRIIRINEDRSIRLLYSGTSSNTTEGYIGLSSFNNSTDDAKYVGYMYGNSGTITNNRENLYSSNIKQIVDQWYETGLYVQKDSENIIYHNYINENTIYCNDRSYEGSESDAHKFFASFDRAWSDAPSYKCNSNDTGNLYNNNSVKDKFTVNNSLGNGNLLYPIGLITADEIIFAGGSFHENAKAWYYYNSNSTSITGSQNWWTMSPYAYNYLGPLVAMEFIVEGYQGQLYDVEPVNDSNAIRPVISLKSCVYWSKGDGSSNSPYEITISEECARVIN